MVKPWDQERSTRVTKLVAETTADVRMAFNRATVNALVQGVTVTELRGLFEDLARRLCGATQADVLPRTTRQRRRRWTPALLDEVTSVYRQAYAEGIPPTAAVAEHFKTSHSSAARWVHQARKAGVLGASLGPMAGEAT